MKASCLYYHPCFHKPNIKCNICFSNQKCFSCFWDRCDKIAYDFPDKSNIKVDFTKIGLKGKVKVRDLWSHKDLGTFEEKFTCEIPQHGAGLYRLTLLK
jgi:hypothetical protein